MPRARFALPSQERLRELFDYDAETGVLTAKVEKRYRGGYPVGAAVGYLDAFGYLKATVDGRPYMLHRLIWKWVTGQEPPDHLDHINRQKADNRWVNLREATPQQNIANQGPSVVNFSGAKGVSLNYRGQWKATIQINGETRQLGAFNDRQDAIDAYNAAAKEAYGEFAFTKTGENRILVDVITLVDEQLLATVAAVARQLWAYRLDKSVPEHVQARLDEFGVDLSTELARIDPKTYGGMRKRSNAA